MLFHLIFSIDLATPGGPPIRNRPSSKMTKYVECWGADKPFANITDSKMAKNIGLAVCQLQSEVCKHGVRGFFYPLNVRFIDLFRSSLRQI